MIDKVQYFVENTKIKLARLQKTLYEAGKDLKSIELQMAVVFEENAMEDKDTTIRTLLEENRILREANELLLTRITSGREDKLVYVPGRKPDVSKL